MNKLSAAFHSLIAVGLGELLFDVVDESFHLGGAPANFAWHCRNLGLKAYAVAAVGDDDLGKSAISQLGSLADFVNVVDAKAQDSTFNTGCVRAHIDDEGIASYSFDEECAFDRLCLNDKQLELARECDLVCFGTLCQRHEMAREAIYHFLSHAKKALKIFDVNLRGNFYSADIIKKSLGYCDIVKLSAEELIPVCSMVFDNEEMPPIKPLSFQDLSQKASSLFEFLREQYDVSGIILTCGAEGSEVRYKGKCSQMTPPKIKLKDTIGAGDSFDAAFGAALVSGASFDEAHALANDVSAYVCSKAGAMVSLDPSFKKRLAALSYSQN